MDIRIFKISLVEVVSNKAKMEEGIHFEDIGSIKSFTLGEGMLWLFGNLGENLKEGIVGIQSVVQMGKEEEFET